MSEVIGVARIDLTSDASSFEAAIVKAKSGLSDFSREAQAAYAQADSTAKRATTSLIKWIQQQEALGLAVSRSAASLKLYNAAAAGVPTKVLEEARGRIDDLISAQESLALANKQVADSEVFEKQHESAKRLAESVEYVNWWVGALEEAERAETRRKGDDIFEQEHQSARKLVQDSEYVRWWEDALERMEAQERKIAADKQFLKALQERASYAGKTATEILELQAAERGLSEQAAPFIAKLRQQEQAMQGGALSAKEMAWAMRLLPAQITDIVTGLASGQQPFTVLIQQGGQLKDMFGGIVPAAKALGSVLLQMITPATAMAAVLAAAGVAAYQGSTRMDELRAHLIMTNNAIGVTSDQIAMMAARLDTLPKTSGGQGIKALTEIAKSGKIAGDQLEQVAEVAILSSRILGREISDVVDEFAKIAEDPVQAAIELDRAYNFLTLSVLRQIQALDEQGRKEEAAKLVQEEFARSTITNLQKVESQLNSLSKAWSIASGFASEAWSKFVGIFDTPGLEQQLESQRKAVEQHQQKLDDLIASGAPAGIIARARQQYDAARRELQRLEAEAEAAREKAEAEARERILKDAKISWDLQGANVQSLDAQRKALRDKEIENAKTWAETLGKSQEELNERIRQINEKYTLQSEKEGDRLMKAFLKQRDAIREQMRTSGELAQEQYQRLLDSFGLGDRAFKIAESERSTFREFRKIQNELAKAAAEAGALETAAYKNASAEIENELHRRLAGLSEYYAREDALRREWALGTRHALANYQDEVNNVFKSVGTLTSGTFQSMEDALVEFVKTGKLEFSDFADFVLGQMARIVIQQSITGPLASVFSSFFGAAGTGAVAVGDGTSVGGGGAIAYPVAPQIDIPARPFWTGGYTGDGSKYAPAGIVHKGEGVLSQEEIKAIGGERGFNELRLAIRSGARHAVGGIAGSPSSLPRAFDRETAPVVTVINKGTPQAVESTQARFDGEKWVIDVVMSDIMRNGKLGQMFRSQGVLR